MRGCAEARPDRETTWINHEIIRLYTALHKRGACAFDRSVGRRKYGRRPLRRIARHRLFLAKACLAAKPTPAKSRWYIWSRCCGIGRYTLLDTQFQTPHLTKFGTFEITRTAYHHLLAAATGKQATPFPDNPDLSYLFCGLSWCWRRNSRCRNRGRWRRIQNIALTARYPDIVNRMFHRR